MSAPAAIQHHLEGLPHGAEFRFLDELLSLEPGRHGTASYTIPPEADFLKGHFPGKPCMPGLLLLEAAAQLAGVVAQSSTTEPAIERLLLAEVRGARFLGLALPGDRLTLEARILRRFGDVVTAAVQASVGARPVLRGEVTLAGDDPKAERATPG